MQYSMTDLIRGKFDDALAAVQHRREEVIITRYGKPVARLVPLEPVEDIKLATDVLANRSQASVPAIVTPIRKRR
jgi:prevent-host-death family protein